MKRALLLALLPFLFLVGTGLAGIDFGTHWDEDQRHLEVLADAVENESLLPSVYNYPSVSFDLSRLALLPDSGSKEEMLATIRTHGFRMRLRSLFLVVSSLAVVWVFFAVRAAGRGLLEALLASALLATSFEVAYHVRWVAPDGLLMSFGALTLFASLRACRSGRWLVVAAIAAGLGCGSKYPGGLLAVPVGIAALVLAGRRPARGVVYVLGVAAVFAVTFLVTTPGAVLETGLFREHVEWEHKHYSVDGHPPYTVEKGWPHAERMLVYLVTQVPSPFAALAVLLSVLGLVGAYSWLREEPWSGLVALSFPVLYAAYMTSVRVMIVRNLLVLAPFGFVLVARGAGFLAARANPRAVVAALGLAVVANAAFVVHAAYGIRTRSPERDVRAFAEDLRGEDWALSRGVCAALEKAGIPYVQHADGKKLAVFRDELSVLYHPDVRWAFDPFSIAWYGPRDVNYVYYPTWTANRILVLPVAVVREMGFPVEALVK